MAKTQNKHTEEVSNQADAAPQNAGDTTASNTERERVANRAYELYLERGASEGKALDDWLTAERELHEADPNRRRE